MAVCFQEADGGVRPMGKREEIPMQSESQFSDLLLLNSYAVSWPSIAGQVWSVDSHHAVIALKEGVWEAMEWSVGSLHYVCALEHLYDILFCIS